MEEIINLLLENKELASSGLVALISSVFGLTMKVKFLKFIKDCKEVYGAIQELFVKLDVALEDKKITKAEIDELKKAMKKVKKEFFDLIYFFKKSSEPKKK